MDKRIKPWVNKKILDYIGEEEPTLTEFICQKVIAHSNPQSILNDVAMVSVTYLDITEILLQVLSTNNDIKVFLKLLCSQPIHK